MTAAARREAVARRRPPDTPRRTAHHAFIRSLPCVACGKPPASECADVLGGINLGLGLSPEDHYLVPLCGPPTVWRDCCHSRLHYRGPRRFLSELGIDALDLALRLWRVSGDREAGASVVIVARQHVAHRAGRREGARR